jgi:hypothetical protein
MKLNQLFKATDKLQRKYMYKYLGIDEQSNGYNIKLFNVSLNELTYIENEWFNQRIIEVL